MKLERLLALVAATLLTTTPATSESPDEGAQASIQRIRAHQAFLADDLLQGRDAGSPGHEIAARYIASQFQALGLEPAGDEGSYLQEVPLLRYQVDEESLAMSAETPEGKIEFEYKKDFLMSGDALRDEATVTAPVVFVGHGVVAPELGYDDYEGVDVEGKIVLWIGGAPASFPHNERAFYSSGTNKVQDAVDRGAVGLVAFSNRERMAKYPWARMTRNSGRPGMKWLDESGEASHYWPEIEGSAYIPHETVAALLAGSGHTLEEILTAEETQTLESFELPLEVTLSQSTGRDRTSSSNVAAILRGSDPELRDEYVLYTAHSDHVGIGAEVEGDEIYNGAYDNALGVAILLEAARLFAEAKEGPARSILFLTVTAEEKGLLGSEYFARFPSVPIENVVANINLDMPLVLYPLADVIAFGAEHSSLEATVADAAAKVGFELSEDPMPEEVLFIRSDQYSFVREGVPSIFFVAGLRSSDPEIDGAAMNRDFLTRHYHMPSDELTLPVDWDSTKRFTEANFLIGLDVANTPDRPSWNEGDFFGERFGR